MAESNLDIVINAIDNASGVLRGLGNTIAGLSGGASAVLDIMGIQTPDWMINAVTKEGIAQWNAYGAAIGLVVDSGVKLTKLGIEGSQLSRQIERSGEVYTSLGASAGAFYDAVVTGARGTVNEYQIMTDTNRAVFAGLFQNTEQAQKFSSVVKMLSDTYGANFIQEWGTAVRALATGRQFRLANLGLVYDPLVGAEYYKQLTGINRELTLQEKQQAAVEYILHEYDTQTQAATNSTLTYADVFEQAGAATSSTWKDFMMVSGEYIGKIPAVWDLASKSTQLFFKYLSQGMSVADAQAKLGSFYSADGLEQLANIQREYNRVFGQTTDLTGSQITNIEALGEAYKMDTQALMDLRKETQDTITKSQEQLSTNIQALEQNLYQVATTEDLTKALDKYNSAVDKANRMHASEAEKNTARAVAFREYKDTVQDAGIEIAKAAGVNYGVLLNMQSLLGNVDVSAVAAFDAFRQLLTLPEGAQAKANLDIINMLGIGDPAVVKSKIEAYVRDLTTTRNMGIAGAQNAPIDFGVHQGVEVDVSLSDEAEGVLKQALAPGVKNVYIRYVEQGAPVSSWSYWARKAGGGPVSSNTPYIVGEKGPEMFVPNSSGNIVPNDKLGGNQYHFNAPVKFIVQGGELNMDKLVRQLGV